MKGKQLTEKQKAFADKYIETGNATEAYKSAYSTSKMSDQVIYNEASKTIRKPLVKDYIDKHMKELEDTKIPKQKEILTFLGGVMRGTEKETVMTDDGLVKVPPAIKQRISAAKELLKRYPLDDPLMRAQLRKLNAEATLAESRTNESEDKTGKLMRFMDKQSNESLQKIIDSLEGSESHD
ncbi:terminase small subunit [Lactobacillus helveticus]|uniref:terminase small subunit n=1 Tax=Lactobacillus helveticus TaxID=1587 RepID=UPI0015644FFC|nr:terminase small subunit [Lactobacillus helveticus]NRO92521.1 hypothetical protein [Lactobacillus helveticus]